MNSPGASGFVMTVLVFVNATAQDAVDFKQLS
jgi:hypothetical protein